MNTDHYTRGQRILASIVFGIVMWALLTAVYFLSYERTVAAAEAVTAEAWIICQPGDYVNVRMRPSTKSESVGRLQTGDSVRVTGKTKDGFALCKVGLEVEEAWIYAGYLVFEKPEDLGGKEMTVSANGRVACRKCVEGARRCWATDGTTVKVHYLADGWAVTNKGFIKSEYLEGN